MFDGTAFGEQMVDIVKAYVERTLQPLRDENAALRARVDGLEAAAKHAGTLSYRGVWTADRVYDVGNAVTFGGSLWHCNALTKDKPGDGAAWTLAVKKGRDGKDAPR